jgi:hypothetical protein
MNKLILVAIIASAVFYSCAPKSYCFFNTRENLFYISEKKDYSIKTISVARTDLFKNFKRNFELAPAKKSYKVTDDSVINQSVYIFIETNSVASYSLKLKKEDWKKETVFKCRYLIR